MEKLNSKYSYLNINNINKLPNTVRLEMFVGITSSINGNGYESNFEEKFKTNQLTVSSDNIDAVIEFLSENAINILIKDSKNLCEDNLIINYNDLSFTIKDNQIYDLFISEFDY